MADKPVTPPTENDELLTTVSVKVPRWVEDVLRAVGCDADLDLSKTCRVSLTELAKHFQRHWRKGPALSAFLAHLEFRPEQYNLFFETRKGK